MQLAAKLLGILTKVLLAQSLDAGANLADIAEADDRFTELYRAHCLVVREDFEERSDLVEGPSIRLARGVGELVIRALGATKERLRAIECLSDRARISSPAAL